MPLSFNRTVAVIDAVSRLTMLSRLTLRTVPDDGAATAVTAVVLFVLIADAPGVTAEDVKST